MSGQSIADRLTAAKHSISGQGLAKAVCKATTEEVMGPKKKHLDYLVQCTHEPNVSIPQLANLLIERTQGSNWVTVFKALVSIHNLINFGNERFTQYLASNNCTLNLSSFTDKNGVQGYDMSTFIRRYAKYINEKAFTYRTMAFDFCKVKRGKTDGLLRTMQTDKLLKTLPSLQHQLDVLVEFEVSANELTNGVINAAFLLLFKDLIRLFACYNDGIINLLEKFFDMPKKQAKEAIDIYKRFLARMERCGEFLKVAESVGIDKGDIPDLAKAPSSLLEALEEHLKSLEGQKKGKTTEKVSGAAPTLQSPTSPQATGGLSEDEKRKIIAEEAKHLESLKERKISSPAAAPVTAASKPVAAAAATSAAAAPSAAPASFSADLLGLGFGDATGANFDAIQPTSNPFGNEDAWAPAKSTAPPGGFDDIFGMGSGSVAPVVNGFNNPFNAPPQHQPPPPSMSAYALFMGGGGGQNYGFAAAPPSSMPQSSSFSGFDCFGGMLQPQNSKAGASMMGQQQTAVNSSTAATNTKLIQKDIDSSLASLAGNLTVGPTQMKTQQQWKPSTEKKLTGGNNWQPGRTMATSTMPPMIAPVGGLPMGGMMYNMSAPHQYSQNLAPSHGYMNGMPYGYSNVPSQPMGMPQMGIGMQPPMGGGMYGQQPPMGMQPMYGGQPRPMMSQQAPAQQQSNPQDPFGAL